MIQISETVAGKIKTLMTEQGISEGDLSRKCHRDFFYNAPPADRLASRRRT